MVRVIVISLALSGACAAQAEPVHTFGEATKIASAAIVNFKLTSNKLECLSLEENEATKKYFLFSVREKHDEICGGDPETEPRLFDLRVYKKNGNVTSDVYGVDGKFQPVDHPLK